ncbi:unnamed protein product [Mytilus coruscus]|uniref:HTH psq-type domain-containing protein n=1 Tax=Mytilus coruscus TaxID=42192 RepID=A0A6J8A2F3_MYTCO|nr:unnamed protein product [Mytilus coruscus]
MIVSGPPSCGKTHFMKNMLQQIKRLCSPYPERIVWLYKRWRPLYEEIQRTVLPRIEFIRGIPFDLEKDDFFDPNIRNMILLYDLMSTSAKDSRIKDLLTEGSQHRNLSVVVLNQNLYFGKDPTQRRNCPYLILFNNPIDRQPIMTLGQQMYPSRVDFFIRKFEEATRTPFGYLLVDLKARTPEASRFRTEVLHIGKGDSAAQDEKMEDDRFSDTFEDNISISSEEDIADETTNASSSSEDSERREDLIACRDCGVVFAHLRALEAHSQQGCGKKINIAFPMTGKDVEDALSGLPVTVCCAEDLPSYAKPTFLRHDKKYRLYSLTALTNAYISVRNKEMSQRKAALQFNVPRQTLRDTITGKISPDCVTTGRAPVFSLEEEARIVEHVKSMASYGYGYTRQEDTDLATDFAHTINIKPRNEELTLRWFEGFIKRWPELRVVKSRSLEIQRAKCGSVANVEKYFASLEHVVHKYNLQDKPHLIFNIDEKGITMNHKPPNVVSGIECNTSSVTTGRSGTTTILGCGSASGFAVPPYFVSEGKRMMYELMNGATPGAVGAVSDSGWSNTAYSDNI